MNLIQPNYLPLPLDKRLQWLNNFVATLAPIAANLGITVEEMARLLMGAAWYGYLLTQYLPYVRSFSTGSTTLLEDLDSDPTPQPTLLSTFAPPTSPPGSPDSGLFNFIVALVSDKILKSANLTPALKTSLRLDPLPQPVTGDPMIKGGEGQPSGHVELRFTRGGSPLVIIECRRGNETTFTQVDKVAASHWIDLRSNLTPGQPEVREYRIRYSDGTNPIGNYSAPFSVATRG